MHMPQSSIVGSMCTSRIAAIATQMATHMAHPLSIQAAERIDKGGKDLGSKGSPGLLSELRIDKGVKD